MTDDSTQLVEQKETRAVSVQPEILLYVDKTDLEPLAYDELVELGKGISEVKIYSQWLLGRLGDKVMQKYGDLKKYAHDINQVYEVLQQYMNTYRKFTTEDPSFTPDKYYGGIPWGMLAMVASKSETPVTLLNELADKGIHSIDGAFREIKTKETGVVVPTKPKLNLRFDEVSGKWKIVMRSEEFNLIDWTDIKEQLVKYLEGLI